MTHDKAVYTVDFEQSNRSATKYTNIDSMIQITTNGEEIHSKALDDDTLEIVITGSSYVIPVIEQEVKEKLPQNTLIGCEVN